MTREQALKMAKAKLECIERRTSGKTELCREDCESCSLCYEQGNMGDQMEWLKMSIKALEQEPKTDGDCIRKKDDEAIEKKLKLAGYEKVVTCAECVHGVEVGLGLYKCLDCDWIGDDDFWCKEGKRREE